MVWRMHFHQRRLYGLRDLLPATRQENAHFERSNDDELDFSTTGEGEGRCLTFLTTVHAAFGIGFWRFERHKESWGEE